MESGLAWRLASSAENFLEFVEFLNIYTVLALSALEFCEFLGIYRVSGGLHLQILVNT